MRRICAAVILILSMAMNVGWPAPRAAAQSAQVVFSQIRPGNISSPRLIELYNNGDVPVDVTGWCVYYVTASTSTEVVCFDTGDPTVHVLLPVRGYIVMVSEQMGFAAADLFIHEGLGNGVNGALRLVNETGDVIDAIGWGNSPLAESAPIALGESKFIERRQSDVPGVLVDTNNNALDFFPSNLREQYFPGSVYAGIDACSNVDGFQATVPDNYELNDGACVLVRVDIPDVLSYVCPGIDVPVSAIPDGYYLAENGDCLRQPIVLDPYITELLPNAKGADEGKEFIELFNPNSHPLVLDEYRLAVGPAFDKAYAFPAGATIPAHGYRAFYNSDIKYTLLNTSSRVGLMKNQQLVHETPAYSQPGEDMAWAFIADTWVYTNRPTPGAENTASLMDVAVHDTTSSTSAQSLVPCRAGQERNPATNRCRAITTASTLASCAVGQERNPDTNRCRAVATSSELAPCKEGQERNPETNRCRTIVAMPANTDYGVQGVRSEADPQSWYWWLAVGAIVVLGGGYAAWEWRYEVMKRARKIYRRFMRPKQQ